MNQVSAFVARSVSSSPSVMARQNWPCASPDCAASSKSARARLLSTGRPCRPLTSMMPRRVCASVFPLKAAIKSGPRLWSALPSQTSKSLECLLPSVSPLGGSCVSRGSCMSVSAHVVFVSPPPFLLIASPSWSVTSVVTPPVTTVVAAESSSLATCVVAAPDNSVIAISARNSATATWAFIAFLACLIAHAASSFLTRKSRR